jgi:2-haloacid dehalogenase
MADYTVLFWDLDDTLLDFKKCEKNALLKSFAKYGRSVGEDVVSLYSKINESYWKRLELGEVTRQELLVGRFRTLFDTLLIRELDPVQFRLTYNEELSASAFLFEDAWEVVAACRNLGLRQYVVTNGVTDTQKSRMHLSKLEQLMDGLFISEEIGAEKPSAAFFDKVFAMLGEVDRKQVLLIGDSLSSDMKGGKNAGIATCWYNPKKKTADREIPVNYEIRSLSDVLALVAHS